MIPIISLHCPKCNKELQVDSLREHTDGKKRLYWDCIQCDISIMQRNYKPDED